MRKISFAFVIVLSFTEANAQPDESIIRQILPGLLDCSLGVHNDTVFLEQDIRNATFSCDSISMEKKTGLQIPQQTLSEIIANSREPKGQNYWNEQQLNEKFAVISSKNDTSFVGRNPYIKCLPTDQLDSVSTYSPTFMVYSISRPVFDNNRQTAVFNLAYGRGRRYFSFERILIKKVFGKWIIIQSFDWRIS